VRPGRDLDFSSGNRDVWVVSLFLGKLTHAIYKPEGSARVGKLEGIRDVVSFDDCATCGCTSVQLRQDAPMPDSKTTVVV
jgi:hypothetical protein